MNNDSRWDELIQLAIEMSELVGLPPEHALLQACLEIDDVLDFAEAWDAFIASQASALEKEAL